MAPSEVAKVRMQTQRNPHPSLTSPHSDSKPKYRGSLHCLKVIAKEEGFGGLYKGCSALLCRDCSSSAIYFLTYSTLCDWLTPAEKSKPGRYQELSWHYLQKWLILVPHQAGNQACRKQSLIIYKISPRFIPHTDLLCVCFLA